MPPRSLDPIPFAHPFTRADLAGAGLTVARLRGWRERNEVREIARGVYIASDLPCPPELAAIWSERSVVKGLLPVSVVGAAHLHGLWIPPNPSVAQQRSDRRHSIPPEVLQELGQLKVPCVAWTAIQLARWQKIEGALVALDSALRSAATVDDLRRYADLISNWPGSGAIRSALDAVDARSESPLESWSRGLMIRHGIPRPDLQHRLHIRGRTYYADFYWAQARVVGEADGLGKYTDREAVHGEKRRQGHMQGAGHSVYRWGWPEVIGDARPWLHGLRRLLG